LVSLPEILGLMPTGMDNIHGKFHWKRARTKKLLPGTQQLIATHWSEKNVVTCV